MNIHFNIQLVLKFVKASSPFLERGWPTQEVGGFFCMENSRRLLTKSPFNSPFVKGDEEKATTFLGKGLIIFKNEL
jgi:hypothetical protein